MSIKQLFAFVRRAKTEYTSYFDNVYFDKGRGFRGEVTVSGVKYRTRRHNSQVRAAFAVGALKRSAKSV